jgi:hypothetical protein
MKNRLKKSNEMLKANRLKKVNHFGPETIVNIGCLVNMTGIFKKKDSFCTLRRYLFLNLPVAFNKN